MNGANHMVTEKKKRSWSKTVGKTRVKYRRDNQNKSRGAIHTRREKNKGIVWQILLAREASRAEG